MEFWEAALLCCWMEGWGEGGNEDRGNEGYNEERCVLEHIQTVYYTQEVALVDPKEPPTFVPKAY